MTNKRDNIKNQIAECEESINLCKNLLYVEKSDFCNVYKDTPSYPVGLVGAEKALDVFRGKWKHAILMRLLKHPSLRYTEIKRELEKDGITDYMLSSSLNDLLADKLITKTIYPEVPVRVEYSVTEKTIDVWYIILQFSHWYSSYRKKELEEELHENDAEC